IEVEAQNINVRIAGIVVRVGDIHVTGVWIPIKEKMLPTRVAHGSDLVRKTVRPKSLFSCRRPDEVSFPRAVHFGTKPNHGILESSGDKVRPESTCVGVELSSGARLLPTKWMTDIFESYWNQVHL